MSEKESTTDATSSIPSDKHITNQDPEYAAFKSQSSSWHSTTRRRLLRKIDFRLLPTLGLIYFLSVSTLSHQITDNDSFAV